MVVINCAYTESINAGPDATPTLSREQVWSGLQKKIREPGDFVPVIKGCDVVEDKGNEVTRVAHFKDGKSVQEVCKSYYPTKVDFHQPDGTLITNTISDTPGLDEKDISLTYTFSWIFKDVQEGSDEHKKLLEDHRQMAQTAVHNSIVAIRKMVASGALN